MIGSSARKRFVQPGCMLVALAGLISTACFADSCHPPYNPQAVNYMVGYGSLMNSRSKAQTAPGTGESLPVTVRGFDRRWGIQGPKPGFGTTFLVVLPRAGATMNAVIFRLFEPAILHKFDRRERLYCRVQVSPSAIKVLAPNVPRPTGTFWIYVDRRKQTAAPSARYPIVQSYVDIFLGGCLDLEQRYKLKGFAKRCVASTHAWSKHWVNDRLYPRRAWIFEPKSMQIDKLLSRTVPNDFAAITLE